MHLADEPIRFAARRRRVAGGLLAALALALCGAAVTLGQGTDAPYGGLLNGCRASRGQPYVSCVSGAVLQYAYQHPHAAGALLGYVADHGRDGGRNVDLRLLSATAHYAGMELAALPLSLGQALGDCGDAFKAACMHGFVMERLDHNPGRGLHLARTFLRYCLPVRHDSGYYENCLHGVGHELWARTRLPLTDTLALCDPLGSPTDRSACWSGVLMEYSEGSAVKGHHSHTPAGERTLPCLSLTERYREVCTYAEASYRQYVPGWEPPRTSYERCTTAPPAYRLRCMTLVSERLLIAGAGSARLANSTCARLAAGTALCVRSIAQLRARPQ